VKGYEPSELNVFNILAQNGLDNILEYTNESVNLSSCPNISKNEFRRFLGTLLLSSTFNLSMDHSFDLMEKLTGCANVKLDRFREILHNIKGYDCSNRKEHRTSDQWSDQRNLLHNLHPLEQKMFERSTDLFFDREYGCYVYDDELLASKATDVELRTLSDRKAGGEGSTIDCICDAFLQVVVGMRLRTNADTQLQNLEKLTERLPNIEINTGSHLGPIMVMDRGFGKLSILNALAKKNFKILTIAAVVGSEHPIVPSSSVHQFSEKISNAGGSQAEMDQLYQRMNPWTISDDNSTEDRSLAAIAVRDIFDKKIAQKILRFFAYGFPIESLSTIHKWLCVPKRKALGSLGRLFHENEVDDITDYVESELEDSCRVLTSSQRTADWFTLRSFHVTATLSSVLLNSDVSDTNDEASLLVTMMKSWFNRSRSTEAMVIGTKNEDEVLLQLSRKDWMIKLFDCGLFESDSIPWLAASPDAIAVLSDEFGDKHVLTVEVKTRVALDKIAMAESIARKYNHELIGCDYGDDKWNECIEADHANQMMVQMAVLGINYCLYVVARPGSTRGRGKIIYCIAASVHPKHIDAFVQKLYDKVDRILRPFFTSTTVEEVLDELPNFMDRAQRQVIATRWPFFARMRQDALGTNNNGFPPSVVFKHAFQSM